VRIAILTNFKSWGDAYSLTHVVRTQALTLAKHGHSVYVFTVDGCEIEAERLPWAWSFWHRSEIPDFEATDYGASNQLSQEHKEYTIILSDWFCGVIGSGNFDLVITHDYVLTGANLPLAEGLRLALQDESLANMPFLHWIHSMPNFGPCDWWDLRRYKNPSRPRQAHKLVYPTRTDADTVAHIFYGTPDDIRVIPPVVDLRFSSAVSFHPDTLAILDELPGLLNAQFAQVYPAPADRFQDKGLDQLIKAFTFLKQYGSVCLLIVDSKAAGDNSKNVRFYQSRIKRAGFSDKEITFTSQLLGGRYADAVPKEIVDQLGMCANILIYPSQGESFGLPLQEQALTGVLTVLNRSLPVHYETGNSNGLYAHFGSCDVPMPVKREDEATHYKRLANMICARAANDDVFQRKDFARRSFNMDRVYRTFYEPVLAEMCGK
jgi:Glycosyltransferase Family 4